MTRQTIFLWFFYTVDIKKHNNHNDYNNIHTKHTYSHLFTRTYTFNKTLISYVKNCIHVRLHILTNKCKMADSHTHTQNINKQILYLHVVPYT